MNQEQSMARKKQVKASFTNISPYIFPLISRAPKSPHEVIEEVAIRYGVSAKNILSPVRLKSFSIPRQIAMYLVDLYFGRQKYIFTHDGRVPLYKNRIGQSGISKIFNRDRTTFLYSLSKTKDMMDTEPKNLAVIKELELYFGPAIFEEDESVMETIL